MASQPDVTNMALFCDFENIALGVRDAKYEKFDIKKVLERLLLKGSIVVKKAYCDWDRYKAFKGPMHEANFELIEIPHVRQSGKNSADIRMVVDALDLCYTKAHVDTFVIISGDSDFSPLVSKLRENDKAVIGVGVKNSTSDLLIANCDEFIYYDDLVRERKARVARKTAAKKAGGEARPAGEAATTPEAPERRSGKGNGRSAPASTRRRATTTKTNRKPTARPSKRPSRRRAQRRRPRAAGARSRARHDRGACRRARRRREDLGLDGEAGAEAGEAGLRRVVLRLPLVQRAARGSGEPRPDRARERSQVRRLHHPADRAGLVSAGAFHEISSRRSIGRTLSAAYDARRFVQLTVGADGPSRGARHFHTR